MRRIPLGCATAALIVLGASACGSESGSSVSKASQPSQTCKSEPYCDGNVAWRCGAAEGEGETSQSLTSEECASDTQCIQGECRKCASELAYCDGSTAWNCNGGGDKGPLVWERRECAAGQECIKGQCLREPLVPCTPDEPFRVRESCSPDGLRIGWCTSAGYWSWMFDCDPNLNAVCAARHVTDDNQDEMWVNCLLTPLETCPVQDSRTCHANVKLECTNLGYWGWPRNCASEGLVCRAGECVAAQ
jgi:hypothetical protein